MHFSYDLEATLTPEERAADLKLRQWREVVASNEVLNRTIHSFYDHSEVLKQSKLFKILD